MTIAVLTPSYGPDFPLCEYLASSVRKHFPAGTEHHIVVPKGDLSQFRSIDAIISDAQAHLPAWFVNPPFSNVSINVRRPFPPIRGWIRQQILKLAVAASLEADVVVVVDSDTFFVQDVTEADFHRDGVARLYRDPIGITPSMTRHQLWSANARRLLGLEPMGNVACDYISSMVSWDPSIVRLLLEHIEQTAGHKWQSEVGRLLHFSESILYGTYVSEVLGIPASSFASEDSRCHEYWGTTPMTAADARSFVATRKRSDLAVMISAKSRTPLEVWREVVSK